MIRRVLIANRGEIALRIIRACRELDIQTVAVYSDADEDAPHTLAADSAIPLGSSAPGESYLNVDKLLAAAAQTGADAVHPGYGFLSERAHFARACADAGVIFVGPPVSALERMGSKIEARQLMQRAGVPVVPGDTPSDQSDAALVRAAEAVGFPALIKPSAGGGGIGMKVVEDAAGAVDAIQRARREAQAAFGDATLYAERLVQRPRHVEIQVFADTHGNVVHLFERECSIQRRHQKTIEESPCPVLTPVLRDRMGAAAVAAARAVDYVNAGTVEFLLEGEGDDARFYFLEMNTRLQVEHPVTELVTGVDLVRAQLLVAGGEPLPWTQAALTQRGHALECRIYAEDPARDFLPQAGQLLMYREPAGPGIRVDAGVVEGSTVSVFYDPLLAKLIAYGETRPIATARMLAALDRFIILGIRTNIPFLRRILASAEFGSAKLHTGFLDAEGTRLRHPEDETLPPAAQAALAIHTDAGHASAHSGIRRTADPFDTVSGWGVR